MTVSVPQCTGQTHRRNIPGLMYPSIKVGKPAFHGGKIPAETATAQPLGTPGCDPTPHQSNTLQTTRAPSSCSLATCQARCVVRRLSELPEKNTPLKGVTASKPVPGVTNSAKCRKPHWDAYSNAQHRFSKNLQYQKHFGYFLTKEPHLTDVPRSTQHQLDPNLL